MSKWAFGVVDSTGQIPADIALAFPSNCLVKPWKFAGKEQSTADVKTYDILAFGAPSTLYDNATVGSTYQDCTNGDDLVKVGTSFGTLGTGWTQASP